MAFVLLHPKNEIRKTALGATESVDWEYFENTADCIKTLAEKDFSILSIEQADNSVELQDFEIDSQKK